MKHVFHEDVRHQEWAYNSVDPSGPEIKRLHRFLLDHKEQECILFHGTGANVPIMEQGMKPTGARTRKSLQSASGYVYLSIFPGMARTFAEIAYASKDVKVYSVTVPIRELKADADQLRNMRYFGGMNIPKDTLACSLALGHGARVKRHIWPYEIALFSQWNFVVRDIANPNRA